MKIGTVAAGVAIALGLIGSAWYVLGRAGGVDDAAERVFVTPERRTMAASVLATGILRLRVGGEVRVGAQLSGIVEKLNVEVGSKIRRGDVIAVIDSRGLQARLAQARAQIAVNEQDVRRASVELARARRLDEKKLVAESQVEDAQIALDQAQAWLLKARRDMEVVQTDLSYAVIRSPIAGTVASVTTQEGETVAASFTTPTFVTVIEDGALELIAMVDETDIGNVAIGNPVTFTVEAYPSQELAGRVSRIAPRGSIVSGVVNFEVMVSIESPMELLKPDMTANVSIRTAEREALVVPSAAVQREGSDRYLWVQADGGLARRAVIIGTRDASFTEIRQGLGPADRVLVGPRAQVGAAGRAGGA